MSQNQILVKITKASAGRIQAGFSPGRWHWEPLLNKLQSKKLKPTFLLKHNKKLIFHLNKSF